MNRDAVYRLETRPKRKIDPSKYAGFKFWVPKAIAEEDQNPKTQLWRGEPTEDDQRAERFRRVKFLRKYEKDNPLIRAIADRLAACRRGNRCCSGACPECGWLLQRWFVRKSKAFISDVIDKDDQQLVAISIIPSQPFVAPDQLNHFSIDNLQRRLNFALDKIGLGAAIGGIDFSHNEDRDGKYDPIWSVHLYIITSIINEKHSKRLLKETYQSDDRIPRPIKVVDFNNSARRRSYALKTIFWRRVGYDEVKADGRRCRNTKRQRLRVKEKLELFAFLNRCGLGGRVIFRGAKPSVRRGRVKIRPPGGSYQANAKKCQKTAKNAPRKASFRPRTLYL